MFCPQCGSKLREDSFFCSVCGTAIVVPEETEPADDLNKLELQYENLLKTKKRKDDLKSEIAGLKKEINKMLTEAEGSMAIQKSGGKEEVCEAEEELRYCPQCGFYVGNSKFCGRCGNKLRN